MHKSYNATTNELLEGFPVPWIHYLGIVADGPVRVIDADVSTVTAEADKVFRIESVQPYLVHVELQSSSDKDLPRRLLRYNALLDYRHDLRVLSVALLLRPKADRENLTGVLDLRLPDGERTIESHYRVVRAWQQPIEPILSGDLGTLPLATLADVPAHSVPAVIRQIDDRVSREATPSVAGTIMKATFVLAGLRFPKDELQSLFKGLHTMDLWKDSSASEVLADLARGDEARRILLRQGQLRFGVPDEPTRRTIEAIDDLGRLEALAERVLFVSNWAELIAEG